ncbi:uncharacterized protein B0H18DRAFT_957781 [Fomitopsis serialis]|uniref:uncharacterized protein n=1 Tax=Fomitopsis serialis TaxID=139415 RepID=UPI00200896A3|nr:uncharacterized protein B0H18DRAFT_957781 [Neoantrodia serialis]KAH9918780.1 hypothetical protein B0H18DRAFT_957781 [Neoantrodia serialis]
MRGIFILRTKPTVLGPEKFYKFPIKCRNLSTAILVDFKVDHKDGSQEVGGADYVQWGIKWYHFYGEDGCDTTTWGGVLLTVRAVAFEVVDVRNICGCGFVMHYAAGVCVLLTCSTCSELPPPATLVLALMPLPHLINALIHIGCQAVFGLIYTFQVGSHGEVTTSGVSFPEVSEEEASKIWGVPDQLDVGEGGVKRGFGCRLVVTREAAAEMERVTTTVGKEDKGEEVTVNGQDLAAALAHVG